MQRKCQTCNTILELNSKQHARRFCADCRLERKRATERQHIKNLKSTQPIERNGFKTPPRWKQKQENVRTMDEAQQKLWKLLPRTVTGSDILHAPPERAAQMINKILSGSIWMTG